MTPVQSALQCARIAVVAERAGLSRKTLYNVRNGQYGITRLTTARRIATALDLPERALDEAVQRRRYDMTRREASA